MVRNCLTVSNRNMFAEDPISELPESSSAFVCDPDGTVSALVSMVKYSPNQAYCTTAEVDLKLNGKYISVEQTENPRCLKIVKVKDNAENMRLLPVYVQAHHNPRSRLPVEHLVDHLSQSLLGQLNLDLKKNVTVDLPDDENLDLWRDKAAFLVTDRQQLCDLTVETASVLKTLHPSKAVKVHKLSNSQLDNTFEYDYAVTGFNRANYLERLFKDTTVFTSENTGTSAVNGYLVAKEGRVLSLYADCEQIAHALLDKYLRSCKLPKVSMCTRRSCWLVEESERAQIKRIHRRHTRAIPTSIKWDRVFALNVGLHIL